MREQKFIKLLALSLLGLLFGIAGCTDTDAPDDSSSAASSQLGLGGDALAQVAQNLTVMAEGAQVGVWTSDYPAALKLAQEKDLPILLFFNGSDWSVASNALLQKLIANQEWLDYQSNLILVYLDSPRHNPNFPVALKAQNDGLRNQFRVNDYPSMLLCTSEGQLAGNLHANSQSDPHDLVRNIKLFRRRIPSEIDKMVAQIENPAVRENYADFKAASEEKRKLIEDAQAKIKELDEKMIRLGTQLEDDIAAWEVSRCSPEDQQAYQTAREAQKTAEETLTSFMESNPSHTPENQRKFQQLRDEIQRQQLIIDEIITKTPN